MTRNRRHKDAIVSASGPADPRSAKAGSNQSSRLSREVPPEFVREDTVDRPFARRYDAVLLAPMAGLLDTVRYGTLP